MPQAFEDYRQWIGREEIREDRMDPSQANAMAVTLDRDPCLVEGDALPHLWHWLYFRSTTPRSQLGHDGHGKKGGFLPPIALPRRMWAGGDFEFHQPVRLGRPARRISEIEAVEEKQGRSGPLVFVTVCHRVESDGVLALTERQRLVYREPPTANATPAQGGVENQGRALRTRVVHPDPVMMFRYSALTFNGHRIHYDRDYATGVEGYPGLVFHGPLTATLLIDLLCEEVPAEQIRHYAYRARTPLFDLDDFTIKLAPGDRAEFDLWAVNHDGIEAMTARAEIA